MVNYVSAEALDEFKLELKDREKRVRREITEQIASAKEQGDLSENFEYQDAKDRQAENEQRIAFLQNFIHNAVLIEKQDNAGEIGLGVKFCAEKDGSKVEYEIVGPSESNPLAGKLSHESPIGKAFMGQKEGDDVSVDTPAGTMTYKVTKIL
jgi:transcription elongation factor GreA